MHYRHIALAALLFAVGCSNKAKEESRAAAAKSAEAAEIDERSRVVAQTLIQKAQDDAQKKREAAAKEKADALSQMRQAVVDHPEKFLTADKLQVVDGAKRHLTSISLTNSSKFSMTEIRGTVDYHGGADYRSDNGDVMAQVPLQLTGALAPGASLVFSEQAHTLSDTPIQLPKAPSSVTFTITKVTVGSEGIDTTPPPAAPTGAL